MKVTKELLKELYAQYNKIYFDGVLGECEFFLFPKTTGFLGHIVIVLTERVSQSIESIKGKKCINILSFGLQYIETFYIFAA